MSDKYKHILKPALWWVIMALGLLIYFAAIRPYLLDRPFSWQSWGETVLLGTLVGFLYVVYSRPRR